MHELQLYDNGGIASGGGGNEILRGTQAVRHIQTNQIKVGIADCSSLLMKSNFLLCTIAISTFISRKIFNKNPPIFS